MKNCATEKLSFRKCLPLYFISNTQFGLKKSHFRVTDTKVVTIVLKVTSKYHTLKIRKH